MLLQRDGTALGDHQLSVAADGGYPGREILDIGDRGGQSDDADLPGKMDDDLLPDRAAEPVGEVMDLVEYDEPQRVERGRMLVEHVAQYLGRHDDDVGLGVDRDVARQQPDAVGAVNGGQVMVLLVAQRLDRRGVERLDITLAGQIHREVGHHGLACARRGRDEHVLPPLQRVYRVLLEIVQVERQRGCETRGDARVMRLTLLECGIPLGRRWAGSIRRRMFALMFDHA